jgi:hypothetical protein
MSKGLTDGGSGQRSAGKNQQTPPDVLDRTSEVLELDAEMADGEADDLPITLVPELAAAEEEDLQPQTESETHKDHPLRQIEIRQEVKRLKALLREVYDEE